MGILPTSPPPLAHVCLYVLKWSENDSLAKNALSHCSGQEDIFCLPWLCNCLVPQKLFPWLHSYIFFFVGTDFPRKGGGWIFSQGFPTETDPTTVNTVSHPKEKVYPPRKKHLLFPSLFQKKLWRKCVILIFHFWQVAGFLPFCTNVLNFKNPLPFNAFF